MTLEIYRLRPSGDDWQLDLTKKVAEVRLTGKSTQIECFNPLFSETLERIFGSDAFRFVGAGQDAAQMLARGTQEWLDHVLKEALFVSALGARVSSLSERSTVGE